MVSGTDNERDGTVASKAQAANKGGRPNKRERAVDRDTPRKKQKSEQKQKKKKKKKKKKKNKKKKKKSTQNLKKIVSFSTLNQFLNPKR